MSQRRKRIEKILRRPTRMTFAEVEKILEDFGMQLYWSIRQVRLGLGRRSITIGPANGRCPRRSPHPSVFAGWTIYRTKGSHSWFKGAGIGQICVPKAGGRWVEEVYLDEVCRLLKLDEIDLDELDKR